VLEVILPLKALLHPKLELIIPEKQKPLVSLLSCYQSIKKYLYIVEIVKEKTSKSL
jgi:hypothetical protein